MTMLNTYRLEGVPSCIACLGEVWTVVLRGSMTVGPG